MAAAPVAIEETIGVIIAVRRLIGRSIWRSGKMNNPVKYFLLHPPIWAEKILAKSIRYRAFVIRECMRMLSKEIEARRHLTVTWDWDEEDAHVEENEDGY